MDGTPDCTDGVRPNKEKVQYGCGKMDTNTDNKWVLPIAMIVGPETRTGLAQNYVAVVSGGMIQMLMVHPDCTDKCAFN